MIDRKQIVIVKIECNEIKNPEILKKVSIQILSSLN